MHALTRTYSGLRTYQLYATCVGDSTFAGSVCHHPGDGHIEVGRGASALVDGIDGPPAVPGHSHRLGLVLLRSVC